MDINNYLEKIVENLVDQITANVLSRVDITIASIVNSRLASYDYNTQIKEVATAAFEKKAAEYTIDPKKLELKIVDKINETITSVQSTAGELINQQISKHIAATDFQRAVTDSVSAIVADSMKDFVFPEKSISLSSINFSSDTTTGDFLDGGIIKNFSSTGIDDRATNVALTILDEATVVENNLLTKDLTVEGSMTINGEFVVNGEVPENSKFYKDLVSSTTNSVVHNLDGMLFTNYSALVYEQIKANGLDLNRVTFNGTEIIKDNNLAPSIRESNLQKLGILKELQVEGESLLSQTLYVSGNRVGVNTIEPSATLSVWDDEVEITISKKQKDTGLIASPRYQKLVLSSNNKDNITLETDGSVSINQLNIGNMKFTESDSPPNYVSTRGHVVWNNNPNLGGPLGWICLGDSRWANFGIID
jgi:hypothetical protein